MRKHLKALAGEGIPSGFEWVLNIFVFFFFFEYQVICRPPKLEKAVSKY